MGVSNPPNTSPTLGNAPLLFWRMDLLKRSFENLNRSGPPLFEKDNYRFFKDNSYRDRVVLPADHNAVSDAFFAIKQRLPVSVVFRASTGEDTSWFKFSGWPVEDRRYYEGVVEEITGHINQLHDIFLQRGRRLMALEDELYPVAIFRRQDSLLVKHNEAFAQLTGIPTNTRRKFRLDSLVATEIKLPLLKERLVQERRLIETLSLRPSETQRMQATCLLKSFDFEGEELIRFGVAEILQSDVDASGQEKYQVEASAIDDLCAQFEMCDSVTAMLDTIYARRDLLPGLDAVMYSDIYARKNNVYVYARGALFTTLAPGSQYPYSGTIAENIEKEKLEYLIVEDTHASIKAIDWALFVPHGVKSYIAKALYSRGAMRTVLIFCSGSKRAFHDQQVDEIARIARAFHRRLKHVDIS